MKQTLILFTLFSCFNCTAQQVAMTSPKSIVSVSSKSVTTNPQAQEPITQLTMYEAGEGMQASKSGQLYTLICEYPQKGVRQILLKFEQKSESVVIYERTMALTNEQNIQMFAILDKVGNETKRNRDFSRAKNGVNCPNHNYCSFDITFQKKSTQTFRIDADEQCNKALLESNTGALYQEILDVAKNLKEEQALSFYSKLNGHKWADEKDAHHTLTFEDGHVIITEYSKDPINGYVHFSRRCAQKDGREGASAQAGILGCITFYGWGKGEQQSAIYDFNEDSFTLSGPTNTTFKRIR